MYYIKKKILKTKFSRYIMGFVPHLLYSKRRKC